MRAEDLTTTTTTMSQGAAGTTGGPRPLGAFRRGSDPARAIALALAIWAIGGFATTVIWAIGDDGYYWPVWVWYGLAIPVALQVGLRWAWAKPPGFKRRIAVQAAISATLFACECAAWAIAG